MTWACEAEHQAIVYSPLRASVLLSVLRESIRFDRDYKARRRDSRILLDPKRRPLTTLVRRASGSPQISLGFVTARARRPGGRSADRSENCHIYHPFICVARGGSGAAKGGRDGRKTGRDEGSYSWRGQLTTNYVSAEHGSSFSFPAKQEAGGASERAGILFLLRFSATASFPVLSPPSLSRTRSDD